MLCKYCYITVTKNITAIYKHVCNVGHTHLIFLSSPYQALHCKNIQKARELWDSIMTKGNAKYANMWLEYYNLERSVNRQLRKKAYFKCNAVAFVSYNFDMLPTFLFYL